MTKHNLNEPINNYKKIHDVLFASERMRKNKRHK